MRREGATVTDPLDAEPPLLPGAFVRVRLPGAGVDRALELPEGVLTRRGQVWYVDDADTLRYFEAETLFTRPGLVYIAEPRPATAWRIVRYPLNGFMPGQVVQVVQAVSDDTDTRAGG